MEPQLQSSNSLQCKVLTEAIAAYSLEEHQHELTKCNPKSTNNECFLESDYRNRSMGGEIDHFHCFPRLPTELRLKVWEFSVAPRRFDAMLRLDHDDSDHLGNSALLCSGQPNPGILGACVESRRVGLKILKPFLHGLVQGAPITKYFNPEIDTVVLYGANFWCHGSYFQILSDQVKATLSTIKNLEIGGLDGFWLDSLIEEVIKAVLLYPDGPVGVVEVVNTTVAGHFTGLENLILKATIPTHHISPGSKEVTHGLLKAIIQENAKLRPHFKVPKITIDTLGLK